MRIVYKIFKQAINRNDDPAGIVHLQKIILRCVGLCLCILHKNCAHKQKLDIVMKAQPQPVFF